jgi:hypothetical protein
MAVLMIVGWSQRTAPQKQNAKTGFVESIVHSTPPEDISAPQEHP